jgi:hypothetical protein
MAEMGNNAGRIGYDYVMVPGRIRINIIVELR